jgi:hypothetical protein
MGRVLVSLVVAASLLSVASSEASAWVCRAAGLGSGGWGRSYSIVDAKLWALRRCEHYSPLPVCTILWCRPGGCTGTRRQAAAFRVGLLRSWRPLRPAL